VYVGVYARTHTHCTCGTQCCEPKGRDETPGGLEESRLTKSRYIGILICVQSTHVYIHAGKQDLGLTAFSPLTCFSC